jgi:hypothetical protein
LEINRGRVSVAAVVVLQTHDVVFTQITSELYFHYLYRAVSQIGQAVQQSLKRRADPTPHHTLFVTGLLLPNIRMGETHGLRREPTPSPARPRQVQPTPRYARAHDHHRLGCPAAIAA